jgi:hypothetical protein
MRAGSGPARPTSARHRQDARPATHGATQPARRHTARPSPSQPRLATPRPPAQSPARRPASPTSHTAPRLDAAGDPGIFLDLTPPEGLDAAIAALPPFDPTRYPLWGCRSR